MSGIRLEKGESVGTRQGGTVGLALALGSGFGVLLAGAMIFFVGFWAAALVLSGTIASVYGSILLLLPRAHAARHVAPRPAIPERTLR